MAASALDYRHGRIVSAYLLGRNGQREEHPAVIISPDTEIVQPEHFDPRSGGGNVAANLVGVMGVSTKYRQFNDPYPDLMHQINEAYRRHLQERLGKMQGKLTYLLALLAPR